MIEGFFSLAWFGWGREDPPAWESTVLSIGTVLGVLVLLGGIVIARRVRHTSSPLADPAARRLWNIIVGTEFASIAFGWVVLGVTGHGEFIAAWVCFVVGIHFVPLDRVFPGIGLVGLG